jgi:hypothetical protein
MDKAALGIGLILTGAFFLWGGVSGRLAPMLAALFSPDELVATTPEPGIVRATEGMLPGNAIAHGIEKAGEAGILPLRETVGWLKKEIHL